ncbi:MAG: thioredoxin-dependent thiol peroxidase [Anaerolineales bacterium]|nr:thioredoxin-dependent thiol peroxidase [Anaerolineales bacterium]
MLQIGEMAPEFALVSDENKTVALSDFRGQRVILFFYPKAGTSGCTTQACGFRDNFPQIEAAGATVVGIIPDTPQQLPKWKAAEKLPYSLLSDPDNAVATTYSSYGEKSMYGRKYMGVIRSHFVIDSDGRLEDVRFKVSPKDSIKYAVQQIVG